MVGGVDDNSISKDVSDGAHVNDENAPASDRSERGVLQEKLKHIIKGGELELEERIEKMTEKVKKAEIHQVQQVLKHLEK